MKIAFCDRDGTLIKDYPDENWRLIEEPEFFEDTIATIQEQRKRDYEIIVVSNQYLIGEGFVTQEHYDKLAKKFLEYLNNAHVTILDVFYCPHRRDEGCTCIKPNAGMVKSAIGKYPAIEMEKSFVVGNTSVDIGLAKNLGIKSFGLGVSTEYSQNTNIGRNIKF